MYDLRYLRDNLDRTREQLGPRGADVPWDNLRTLIEQRRALTAQVEQLRSELKKGSEDVAKLKREKQPADAAMAAMKAVGERIKTIEDELRSVEEALTDLNLRIPNLPHASVPTGKNESSNVEAKRWERSLDRASKGDEGVPATQMLQYLSRVDVQTSGKVRLGILTNGQKWRLRHFGGCMP